MYDAEYSFTIHVLVLYCCTIMIVVTLLYSDELCKFSTGEEIII